MAETYLHQIFIPSFPQSDWTIKRRNYLKTSISQPYIFKLSNTSSNLFSVESKGLRDGRRKYDSIVLFLQAEPKPFLFQRNRLQSSREKNFCCCIRLSATFSMHLSYQTGAHDIPSVESTRQSDLDVRSSELKHHPMFLRRNSAISSSTTSSDPDTTHSECIFQFLQELIPTSESKDSDYEKYRESKVCNLLSHSNSVDRIQTRNILLIFVVCMSIIRFWLSFNSYKKNNKYQAQIQVQGRKIVYPPSNL